MAERNMERDELVRAVLAQVEKLPDDERQLLALYHGAGLPRSEIGQVLAMPQWTVSRKLQGAIERLRAGLAGDGCCAAAPLLNREGLREALLKGHPVPSGMFERLMGQMAKAAGSGRRICLRP